MGKKEISFGLRDSLQEIFAPSYFYRAVAHRQTQTANGPSCVWSFPHPAHGWLQI